MLSLNAGAKAGVLAALIALDAAGLVHCGILLAWSGLARVGGAVLVFLALGLFYQRWRPEERLADLAHSAARLLVFFAAMGVLSYLVATTGLPVADDLLARGDRALGLDWPGWFAFVQRHPVLAALAPLAYMSALPQIAIITSYLGLTGQRRRNSELFWTLTISLLIIVPVSGCCRPSMPRYITGSRDSATTCWISSRCGSGGSTSSTYRGCRARSASPPSTPPWRCSFLMSCAAGCGRC